MSRRGVAALALLLICELRGGTSSTSTGFSLPTEYKLAVEPDVTPGVVFELLNPEVELPQEAVVSLTRLLLSPTIPSAELCGLAA